MILFFSISSSLSLPTSPLLWRCLLGVPISHTNKTVQSQSMINNYLEHDYHPSDIVYTHEQSGRKLHLGDISSALDTDNIKREAITTVITAAAGMEQVQYDSSITHIVYPLLDAKSENIGRYFSQFYELIERELTLGNVLVHCAAGISRSSTLVIAYLMRKKLWSFKEAIAFVRKSRPTVLPNLGFERQLKQYQSVLNRQAESSFQRRMGSKTSEERKHVIARGKVLPQIALMGRTQLRPKILDIFSLQSQSRPSQQRSRGSTHVRDNQHEQRLEFYGTKRAGFKPKKSKSIQDRLQRPFNLSPLYSDQSRQVQRLKGSMPLSQLQDMMVQRMNLNLNNSKKNATERQIRVKPLHKLAFF